MELRLIRQKYLDFFVKRGHTVVPSSSLVPEGDATTLFTSAGMQPMMPYLLGENHPSGKRIVDSQKCFRSLDIEEVGDNRHTTFFEMLGNWSFGDYFKKEQLTWFFEFLTDKEEGIGLDPAHLYVSVFAGGSGVDPDQESIDIWKSLFAQKGIDAQVGDRIFTYPAKKNWWSRSGEPENMPTNEPGGPDSEVFYDFGANLKLHENSVYQNEECHPNCDCGRFLEIGNSVFMQFQKQSDGTLKELSQKNIDFGGGLIRLAAATNHNPDIFLTSIFQNLIKKIEDLTEKKYLDPKYQASIRIIADHFSASCFLIKDGVIPSNKSQGYVLRRLLRRCAVKLYFLSDSQVAKIHQLSSLVEIIVNLYSPLYFDQNDTDNIKNIIADELKKFSQTLDKGLRELNKLDKVSGKNAFDLYQNYGFPLEITIEVLKQLNKSVDINEFSSEFEKHKNLSRTASAGMFKGGLSDHSQTVTAYHTATHLLHAALRQILGNHVSQKGSNITADRLRFDFSHPEKITDEQIKQIEELINQKITARLPVTRQELPKEEAIKQGALAFFGQKYPDIVSVYTIGSDKDFFSRELCGGPHVTNTKELAIIKIVKQESLGAGIRRLYLKFS